MVMMRLSQLYEAWLTVHVILSCPVLQSANVEGVWSGWVCVVKCDASGGSSGSGGIGGKGKAG